MSRRVLMVVGAYFPELAGGSLQCRTLVRALKDRVRFSVLTTTSVPDAPEYSEVEGVPVYRVYVDPRDWWSKLAAAWRLLQLLPRLIGDHDLFHFHGFTEKMLLLLAAAKCTGRPAIEKPTSLGWDDPVAIRRRPLGGLLAAAQSRVDRIVAVTPAMREQCRQAGVRDEAIVSIPNGVDTERFAPVDEDRRRELRARLGLPPDACLVTFVGFWSREKAPDVLFAAWQRARRQTNADAALLFIGSSSADHPEADASLTAKVRQDVDAEGLGARVFFVERTDDVASYLGASDVFVLPSLREGLSNALLEAMSTGLACVCADLPGGTDAVIESGVNGWRVPPGDIEALARVLATLFQDVRTRRDAGTRARATILERYTIHIVAERYLSLYDELTGNAAARPAMPRRDRSRFASVWPLLVAALVIGAAWAAITPPFEGADERAHFTAFAATRSAAAARAVPLKANPIFDAVSNQRGRVNAFMHGQFEGASRADLTRMYALRALTLATWVASLLLMFDTARLVFGRNDLALLTAALVLCLPGVSALFSTIQPMALWVLIGSTVYWTLTARAMGRIGRAPVWLLGAVALGLAIWLRVFATLRTAVAPFLPSYPYHWWPSDFLSYLAFEFAPRIFFAFSGWLGQQSLLLPAPVYAVIATACGVAVCGLALRLRAAPLARAQWRLAAIYGGGVCVTFAFMLYTNVLTDRTAATGTWLYPSLAPIMIALVVGGRWAAVFSRRSPHLLAIPLAAVAVVMGMLWMSGAGDIRGAVRFNYAGDVDHLSRTVLYTIVLLSVAAGAVIVSAWRRRAQTPGESKGPILVLAVAWVLNVSLLAAFVLPRYAALDAEGVAAAVREAAADGEPERATELYRMGTGVYPDSVALSRAVIDLPSLDLKGRDEATFTGLRARLARGETLNNRAEMMAFARLGAMKQAFDPEIMRAIGHRVADTPALQEPRALIRALADRRLESGSAAEVVRAAGGTPASVNMHDDAALEGFAVHRNASDRNEVTVYFRPLRPWTTRLMWVHAYPEGSREYVALSQTSPAYADWKTGSLAWETFELPSNAAFVLYIGVEVDHDLGPAFPIGAVGR